MTFLMPAPPAQLTNPVDLAAVASISQQLAAVSEDGQRAILAMTVGANGAAQDAYLVELAKAAAIGLFAGLVLGGGAVALFKR